MAILFNLQYSKIRKNIGMRNYLIDYQLSKIVHASYIYIFYYRCIYRYALKVKGSCATPHLKTPKLKI